MFRARISILVLLVGTFVSAFAQELEVSADHSNGIYKLNEPIHWRVSAKPAAASEALTYTIRKGGLTQIAKGELKLTNGEATVDGKLDAPGTLLLEVRAGKYRAVGGAVAAADQITVSTNRPADFDAFWAAKIKELEAVPANPRVQALDVGVTNIEYAKIDMDNIRGARIHGQIARPAQGEKFPALLIVQWAGVYSLERGWVTNRAAQGWLALNIEAHDLPIDEPKEFYDAQNRGPLKSYPSLGNDDRERSYFLRMYLSCYRAAEYLTQRPDWNGKTLVVMGDSQGGMQSLVTAGLHPKISACLPLVPAGCDLTGPVAGRAGGWPGWFNAIQGKDPAQVREASRYFDAMNFASRIKCPTLVGLGLVDETCPPEGVLATANQIKGPHEIVILPTSGHQDVRGTQKPYRDLRENTWLPALREGKLPPFDSKAR